jgi:hypothetical protein
VIAAFIVAAAALAGFIRAQQVVAHPMMPLQLFRSRTVVITVVSGFAFMVGYYGLPFVISLFLQQHRGLNALQTGVVFLPMMLIGLVLTPFSARISERLGRKTLIAAGLLMMTVGLAAIGLLPGSTPLWLLAGLMVLVGLGGPTVSPPATAVLLDVVPHDQAGVASGVFNTSRQVGGALAIAVFGGLLADPATFVQGVHTSLLIAAGEAPRVSCTPCSCPPPRSTHDQPQHQLQHRHQRIDCLRLASRHPRLVRLGRRDQDRHPTRGRQPARVRADLDRHRRQRPLRPLLPRTRRRLVPAPRSKRTSATCTRRSATEGTVTSYCPSCNRVSGSSQCVVVCWQDGWVPWCRVALTLW